MKCIFAKTYREALIDFDLARALNGNTGIMDHPYDFYSSLCYLQLNEFDSAEIFLRKCIDESTRLRGENWVHYLHWFYLGVIYQEKEDYKTALQYFNKALIDYPDFSDAEYYKACCQMELNDYKGALATITKAKQDHDKGYTLNEDSIFYEQYPYQVKKFYFKGTVKWIEGKNKE